MARDAFQMSLRLTALRDSLVLELSSVRDSSILAANGSPPIHNVPIVTTQISATNNASLTGSDLAIETSFEAGSVKLRRRTTTSKSRAAATTWAIIANSPPREPHNTSAVHNGRSAAT
jgi:hypothetical protein